MSDILGLNSANFSNGTEELIAVWLRAPMIRGTSTWSMAPITLTTNTKAEMDMFLDHLFLTNGIDNLYAYDGTNWNVQGSANTTNVDGAPKGYFIRTHGIRVYLADVTIASTRYRSRVWTSSLPKNNKITWDLVTGSDLSQTASDETVTSVSGNFKTFGLNIGDPFLITSGTNAGEYTIASITNDTTLELTEELDNTATNSSYWTGGNWFDVRTDDGDFINGLGETSNELFIFKKNTAHRWNLGETEDLSSGTLRQIKNAPGTTSSRSIVSMDDYVYWYHPSGIYRSTGGSTEKISNAVEDLITAISDDTAVVGWVNRVKETLDFSVGSLTTRDKYTITNCVLSFDLNSEIWSTKSYGFAPRVATEWLEDNSPNVYVGDSASSIFQVDTGTNFNSSKINFELETRVIFPLDSESIVDFNRIRAYIDNGPDVQVTYKLYYRPLGGGDNWYNDKDWSPMIGSQRAEKTTWTFPPGARAAGVQFKFVESSSDESFLLEKFVIYYSNPRNY